MDHTLPEELSPRLIDRLLREGVNSLEAWTAPGTRRKEIFGVTRVAIEQLDALAKAERKQKRSA